MVANAKRGQEDFITFRLKKLETDLGSLVLNCQGPLSSTEEPN